MNIILIITILLTLIQVFRVSIYFLRKDISVLKKIIELLILIVMILLEYFNLVYNNRISIIISFILSIYILVCFLYQRFFKNEYISILSIKNGIDLSDTGIMFLNKKGDIILINNLFYNILDNLGITNNYINNLISKCFLKIDDDYLLKYKDKVYMLKIYNNDEISLIDVTELYNLQEEEKRQNKKIKENNNKILKTLCEIDSLEKEKNILKLKNEYHDIIGYRLALFNKYLDNNNNNINIKDSLFLLDSIYKDFNSNLNSYEKLNNLIKMYYVIGIKINLVGNLPKDKDIANIFFEVIREAVTNAIIHADSEDINIVIKQIDNNIEMVITNNIKKPISIIFENEGIKGMRKKLASINGNLKIVADNKFKLIVKV